MDGWSLVHPQSGDCMNSRPSKTITAVDGAVYLCQIGDSLHMRPMGIYTNLAEIFNFIHLGWPELTTTVLDHGTSLSYSGPMQKACSCVQRHKAFRGTSSDGSVLSQTALGLSSMFWHRCFTNLELSNSLRDGEKCGDSVSGSFPSLSSAGFSVNMLYTHWKERKLCRSVLQDFALGEDPELFFKRCPGGEFKDCGKLVAGIIFFWLRRWYANFGKMFFAEEHFVKAEEGEDWHVTNYGRAPGSK